MKSNRLLPLACLLVLTATGSQAQVKYLDCGIDFACPYFSG